VEIVKIPASKMAARNRVQYHPPPPISFCEGPRIIQKLKDVVVQILELPLYISILFGSVVPNIRQGLCGRVGNTCTSDLPALKFGLKYTVRQGLWGHFGITSFRLG
jgi:hypothetical protein